MNVCLDIAICKSVNFHIRNLWRIRKFITRDTCHHAVRASVLSRIDYKLLALRSQENWSPTASANWKQSCALGFCMRSGLNLILQLEMEPKPALLTFQQERKPKPVQASPRKPLKKLISIGVLRYFFPVLKIEHFFFLNDMYQKGATWPVGMVTGVNWM